MDLNLLPSTLRSRTIQRFFVEGKSKHNGHEFEKAVTTTQVSGSTGHHRIIFYNFSDLKFIPRYETDVYVGELFKSSIL